ncbi:hypothetical protein [uncultured Ruegeria sp.]|uniref:phage tail fiber protein n=1 Tax=uncultured Ruegeria sp. TaxID=259304 RepID=UPI00262C5E67|nr:hypothetical protein [uncultured Ruegeria sp.]
MKKFIHTAVAVLFTCALFVGLSSMVAHAQSKSDAFETDVLALIYNGTAIADLAENDSSSPATNLYLSLHSANPGEAGNQSTSECAYTGYARVAVARTSAGFTVSGNSVSLTSAVDFPAATGGTCDATYFAVGTGSSGATDFIVYGSISPTISISNGVTPRLGTGTTITED